MESWSHNSQLHTEMLRIWRFGAISTRNRLLICEVSAMGTVVVLWVHGSLVLDGFSFANRHALAYAAAAARAMARCATLRAWPTPEKLICRGTRQYQEDIGPIQTAQPYETARRAAEHSSLPPTAARAPHATAQP